ncbi:TPA: hypothetical protein I7E69_002000 [Vibrio cholerae]|nr:hypothetical protein [Vibrio cholerae]
MNFHERLHVLLKGRNKTTWGKALGFTSQSITAFFCGHLPETEFLHAIRRTENVNLNWLLTGQGNPFIVQHFSDNSDFVETVDSMLADEDWTVYIGLFDDRVMLAFTQLGKFELKGKWIDYTLCEVLVGEDSEDLALTLCNHIPQRNIYVIESLAESTIKLIADGQLGTYSLLINPKSHLNKYSEKATPDNFRFPIEPPQTIPVTNNNHSLLNETQPQKQNPQIQTSYQLEILKPEESSCVALLLESGTPFMPISVGDMINTDSSEITNEGKKVRVTKVEHTLLKVEQSSITHRVRIYTELI